MPPIGHRLAKISGSMSTRSLGISIQTRRSICHQGKLQVTVTQHASYSFSTCTDTRTAVDPQQYPHSCRHPAVSPIMARCQPHCVLQLSSGCPPVVFNLCTSCLLVVLQLSSCCLLVAHQLSSICPLAVFWLPSSSLLFVLQLSSVCPTAFF